uniref:cysteine proteinase inhibitor 5-like n=1 Tax=Erigeron canadensis TaxID=72917 RepID=UPI001CB9B911|nr:cysteine proteinase inhibitor 5-like [Erigeron canadensis]
MGSGSAHQTLFYIIPAFFLVSAFLDISCALGVNTTNDDWKSINPSDPDVVSAGEFAVVTHDSQTQATLVYDHVVHCETKIDGGRNYNLTIAAKNSNSDPTVRKYIALVIDRPYKNGFELESFRGPI